MAERKAHRLQHNYAYLLRHRATARILIALMPCSLPKWAATSTLPKWPMSSPMAMPDRATKIDRLVISTQIHSRT